MTGWASVRVKASVTFSSRSFWNCASELLTTSVSWVRAVSVSLADSRARAMPTRASTSSGSRTSAARNSRSAAPGRRCSNRDQAFASVFRASGASGTGAVAASSPTRWHFLYFLPEPHGQTSFRPVAARRARAASTPSPLAPASAFASALVLVAWLPASFAALLLPLPSFAMEGAFLLSGEHRRKLSLGVHGANDVAAAHQLAVHVQLGEGGPARIFLQSFAQLAVGQD